ncbi:MAG TPA: hypothetical protein VGN07_19405 [Steroidobacteraceae bacterium]|jgi:hypothetical protein
MKARTQPRTVEPSFQLFLRIKHPALDPEVVTEAIGLQPEHSVRAGRSVSRSGVERLHSESYWIASLSTPITEDDEPADPLLARMTASQAQSLMKRFAADASGYDGFIELWLRRLGDQQALLKRINDEGGSVTLVVQRADHDRPVSVRQALRRLAELGIGLEID